MNDAMTTAQPLSERFRATSSKRVFIRHFGEMLVAMLLGMAVLGGAAQLAFLAAGTSVGAASGAVQVLLMGLSMTVPMVAWMLYRGHGQTRTLEMGAAMVVPSSAAAALAGAGALEAQAALGVQHAAMIPAMLAVMLCRYGHYATRAGTAARPARSAVAEAHCRRPRRSRTPSPHRRSAG